VTVTVLCCFEEYVLTALFDNCQHCVHVNCD